MRSVGAVLSVLWIIGISGAIWLLVTEDPASQFWLVRFVVVPPAPGGVPSRLDQFSLMFQYVDPPRFLLVVFGPIVVGWILVVFSNLLSGRRRRDRIR